jgi:hypothetical protein
VLIFLLEKAGDRSGRSSTALCAGLSYAEIGRRLILTNQKEHPAVECGARLRLWCQIVGRDKRVFFRTAARDTTRCTHLGLQQETPMPNEPALIEDLEWLVKHRSENQRLALHLYEILENERLLKDSRLVTAAGFLVSIVFALWRAVFICPPAYDSDKTLAAAKKFLANVIEDNAITYFREKEHQNWTFSYFINNAALRLEALSSQENFKDFNFVDPVSFSRKKLHEVWRDRKKAWLLCHEAAKAAVHKLNTLLSDC